MENQNVIQLLEEQMFQICGFITSEIYDKAQVGYANHFSTVGQSTFKFKNKEQMYKHLRGLTAVHNCCDNITTVSQR